MLTAEVISIGDELTSGQRLDTNSQWLSLQLGEMGLRVLYHTTVADDLQANVRAFAAAADRADVVVVTGGLGPTADDLTREALAQMAGVALVLDERSLAHIRALFAQRSREMPERNVVQAMFPGGAVPIFNPHGTAPGIYLEHPREGRGPAHVFALPGVPAEMKEMWTAVADRLKQLGLTPGVIRHRRIKCFGVGESDLEQRLPDLIRRGRQPSVGITVSGATITLRITASAATPEACQELIAPTERTIRECLGSLVFGEEDDELEHAVARRLVARKQTLATVEWGTGGLVSHWLRDVATDVPGIEPLYLGGVVLSTAAAATQLLAVPAELLESPCHHSREAAAALAEHGRGQLGADYALAVGPFPAAQQNEADTDDPPRVHLALADAAGVDVRSPRFTGHPGILKIRAAKQALNLLRLALETKEDGPEINEDKPRRHGDTEKREESSEAQGK